MTGPCMCGDTQCSSCGPAQGNDKCALCGAWFDECCDHIDEDGQYKPEYADDVAKMEADDRAAKDQMVKDWEEEEKLAEAYWADPAHHQTTCPHGNKLGECGACDVAADLAYDATREGRR